jgi:hypothetical protein
MKIFTEFLAEAFPPSKKPAGPPKDGDKQAPPFGQKPGGSSKFPPSKTAPASGGDDAPPMNPNDPNAQGDSTEIFMLQQQMAAEKEQAEADARRAKAEQEAAERQKMKQMRLDADNEVADALADKYNDQVDSITFFPDMLTFADFAKDEDGEEDEDSEDAEDDEESDDDADEGDDDSEASDDDGEDVDDDDDDDDEEDVDVEPEDEDDDKKKKPLKEDTSGVDQTKLSAALRACEEGMPGPDLTFFTERETVAFFFACQAALQRNGWLNNDWTPAADGSDIGVGASYQYEKDEGERECSVTREGPLSVSAGGWFAYDE